MMTDSNIRIDGKLDITSSIPKISHSISSVSTSPRISRHGSRIAILHLASLASRWHENTTIDINLAHDCHISAS
jgi:hypothetical protein